MERCSFSGTSLFRRSEQARASGNDNFGEIAGATALDTFGLGGLVEGIRGRQLVTGRCLSTDERSRGIGQGIGNAIALAGGSKVFKSAYSGAYLFRGVPQGLTKGQFGDAADIIRASKAGQYSDDIVVQGSRANGTARLMLRLQPSTITLVGNMMLRLGCISTVPDTMTPALVDLLAKTRLGLRLGITIYTDM